MSRLPIRARLTLAFALAMAIVLAVVGGFLYVRLGASLEQQLDENLELRAEALSVLVRERGGQLEAVDLGNDDENVAQVLDPDAVPSAALISPVEAERAKDGAFFLRREFLPALADEPARFLVTPVSTGGEPLVLVVGASLEDR